MIKLVFKDGQFIFVNQDVTSMAIWLNMQTENFVEIEESIVEDGEEVKKIIVIAIDNVGVCDPISYQDFLCFDFSEEM